MSFWRVQSGAIFMLMFSSDDLLRSTAQGKLSGTGFRLALPISVPMILHNFSLDVDRSKIRVQSAALKWEDRQLAMEGSIDLLPEAILLDMDVSIDGLQWEKIEKILKSEDRKTQSEKIGQTDPKLGAASPKETKIPPLRGRIGVKSPYLEYGKLHLEATEHRILLFLRMK